MSITTSILSIVGSVFVLVAGWYFQDILKSVVQKYYDWKNEQDDKKARESAQAANQKANAESDKLKKIDGR